MLSRDSNRIYSFRNTLLIIVPSIATIFVFWKFFLVFQVPFRLDYAEGFVFTNTISILHGHQIYQSINSIPYIFGFYTPLYNYISAFFLKLFGTDISVLRFISFIFFIVTGICVSYIVNKITKKIFNAILVLLLFYSAFVVSQWSSIARPDMLGIFLISLGITAIYMKHKSNFTKIVIVAFIFSLAFFSKQSFVFAPLAFFISLLFKNKKEAWNFAGIYAFFIGIGVFLLHILTHGEFTKQIFIYPSLVPYGNFYTVFRISAITCISALPLIIIAFTKLIKNPKSFLSLYFLCSLLTFLMLFRDGGIQNYLLEFVLALLLLSMTSISWKKFLVLSPKYFYPLLIILMFFFSLWSFSAFPWETRDYLIEREILFNNEISVIYNQSSVLVEDPLVALATDSIVKIDPYTYGQISDSGLVSNTEFFSEIKNGNYLYIDDYGAFNRIPGFRDLINNNYKLLLKLNFSKSTKPFDYSLYNRNTIYEIGNIYKYNSEFIKKID